MMNQPFELNRLSRDRILTGLAFACLLSALWSAGFDAPFLCALCLAACLGYLLGLFLLQNDQFCFSLQVIITQFFEPFRIENDHSSDEKEEATKKHLSKNPSVANSYVPPSWDRIRLDKYLNRELEELFETLLDNYVNNWYSDTVSQDSSFLLEIRHLIRHSSAKLINCLDRIDLHSLFVDDLFPLVLAHVERICRLSNKIFQDVEIQQTPPSFVEYKLLEQWSDDLHWALRSPQNYNNYLRSVADLLVRHIADDIRIGGCFVDEEHLRILSSGGAIPSAAKWSCHGSRHFLRELLFSTILVPSINFVSDPDSLNQLALTILNSSTNPAMVVSEEPESAREQSPAEHKQTGGEFLAKFAEPCYTHTPDSLLCLKLNDLVDNPYLTKLFEMYLRDLNGPTHLLDCFMQARDIHLRIQTHKSSDPSKSIDTNETNEISFDAWQLFSTFVHSNGPNRIHLSEGIEQEFSEALQSDQNPTSENENRLVTHGKIVCLKSLERVIEQIYQQVYHDLQYNYVIPFCQSENYLGYLCGAPPDVDELIRGPSEEEQWAHGEHGAKIPEGTFSLTQFRKKLFNFITPSKEASQSSSASTSALEEFGASADDTLTDNEGELVETANIAMIDLGRDLNKWTVSIEGMEQRRSSPISCYFAFCLVVERNDLPEECYTQQPKLSLAKERSIEDYDSDDLEGEEEDDSLPRVWTVFHRYEEFYALEDRLREQYGNTLRMSTLPDRRPTLQLLQLGRNNRTLMESHKAHFERFLQQLLQQPILHFSRFCIGEPNIAKHGGQMPNLKRSDWLYAFLTSEENSTGLFDLSGDSNNTMGMGGTTTFLTDLNPIRAMRKVGGKERGQNLKPFILNLLANTLAPSVAVKTPAQQQQQQRTHQRQSSNSLYEGGGSVRSSNDGFGGGCCAVQQQISTPRSVGGEIAGTRSVISADCMADKRHFSFASIPASISFPSVELDEQITDRDRPPGQSSPNDGIGWKSNFYDLLLFLVAHLGFIARLPIWLESMLCSLRSLFAFLFSLIIQQRVNRMLDVHVLNVDIAIYLVRSFHELILYWNMPNSSSLSATPSQMSVASAGNSQQRRGPLRSKQRQPTPKGHQSAVISEQERQLRAELVLHCLEKRVQDNMFPSFSPFFHQLFGRFGSTSKNHLLEDYVDQRPIDSPVRLLFLCFQMPTLNRQLAFVLLDRALQRIVLEQPTPATMS